MKLTSFVQNNPGVRATKQISVDPLFVFFLWLLKYMLTIENHVNVIQRLAGILAKYKKKKIYKHRSPET